MQRGAIDCVDRRRRPHRAPTATSPTRSAPTASPCSRSEHGIPFYVAAPHLDDRPRAGHAATQIPIEERTAARGRPASAACDRARGRHRSQSRLRRDSRRLVTAHHHRARRDRSSGRRAHSRTRPISEVGPAKSGGDAIAARALRLRQPRPTRLLRRLRSARAAQRFRPRVPTATRSKRAMMSTLRIRTQPFDPGTPKGTSSGVP